MPAIEAQEGLRLLSTSEANIATDPCPGASHNMQVLGMKLTTTYSG